MNEKPEPPRPGSFAHAEVVRAREMARLTPKQRIKIVCSMNSIARRAAAQRTANRPSVQR